MSFGFGGNNNNNSTFGGFGSSNTGGGFGSNTNTNTTSGGSLFGGNTSTAGGFGGFGATNNTSTTNNSPFGAAKPAFGAPAASTGGGGLFGANTSTAGAFGGGGGGFGSTNTASTGFGNNAGGGLFGQNKPATGGFGSTNTGSSLFGGGSNTTTGGGFGSTSKNTTNNPFSTNTSSTTGFGGTTNNTSTGGFGGFGATSTATNSNNQGTAAVPFQATNEKDGATPTVQAYQSITFQDPYKNKSFEELRTEDYAQGRRFGNSNGQAGSFGQSTGFGGFGASNNTNTSGGLFGANTGAANTTGSTSTFGGFGANNTNANAPTTSFGSNTGGGLFGNQNKPAAGGLFGNNASSGTASGGFGSTASGGGGLFGGNTSGGFGAGSTTTGTTGGGLFGGGNTQQAQPQTNAFGASSTGGSLFGNQNKPAAGGLFGSSNTATPAAGGLFGNNTNTQPNNTNPFGASTSNTGGGLFGNNAAQQQNKPAFGGFGQNATTGGGAFGTTNNAGGGLFGSSNTQANTGGGLFGNQNQNKPAGTSLFGASTSNTGGGGLFGNTNNNQSGGSLFGNSQNTGGSLFGNAQSKPTTSLFGNNTSTSNTGGGLFGGSNQQNQSANAGGSLFGGNQNQQNGGNSLFGGSTSQQQQQPNQLHASIGGAPYGNEQLFSSLAAPSPPIGPLATPLSGAKPAPKKTPSLMASMRLNSPVYTPRGGSLGRTGGYGFSYSTYGTPGSAFTGSLTPGASSLLRPTGSLGSALTSRLNKSVSMSNLRGDGTPGESSLLRSSALSPPGSGASLYGQGNVRKLKIDRSLRTDLFGARPKPAAPSQENDDQTPRKQVSWSAEGRAQDKAPEPSAENALVRTEEPEQEEPQGLPRGGTRSNGASKAPEMSQINGSAALTTVPENEVPRPSSAPTTKKPTEKVMRRSEMGEYYTTPALRDLKNMSRGQLQKVGKFTVGREGIGRIQFGNGQTVDLSTTNLEDICGKIVQLTPRSATVYLDDSDKPAMGKALNVPSTIALEQSWPRSHGGKKAIYAKEGKEYDKHIARLRRVGGTKFQSYDADTGVWTFTVDHFTTYGLDDDDFDDETEMQQSGDLSEDPATPGQQEDETMQSIETGSGDVDDTFQFKLNKRSQQSVPGGFDTTDVMYDYEEQSADEAMDSEHGEADMEDPFTSPGGAVQAPSPGAVQRYHSSMVEEDETHNGDVDMAAEVEQESPEMPGAFAVEPKMPRSILKPTGGLGMFASPQKLANDTWEEQLQRTISPRKRDRQALKDEQGLLMKQYVEEDAFVSPFKQSMLDRSAFDQSYLAQKSAKTSNKNGANVMGNASNELGRSQAFKTSMDIMKSLWGNEKAGRKAGAAGKGFEYPYPKKTRLSTSDNDDMDPLDREWHDNVKPSFDANGTFVYSTLGSAAPDSTPLATVMRPLVGARHDVRFARFSPEQDGNSIALQLQKDMTKNEPKHGDAIPFAATGSSIIFSGIADQLASTLPPDPSPQQVQELAIWQTCGLLFDQLEFACPEECDGVPNEVKEKYGARIRMEAFKAFWMQEIRATVNAAVQRAKTAEEKALLLLTQGDVRRACDQLTGASDFRLATLVSQLPGTQASREVMGKQIEAWRKRKDWSEMSDAIRAIYCISAGEVCVVPSQSGAAEDRAAEFNIAEHFGMTWKQSFALRVCYGGHDNMEGAIDAYCADLDSGREHVKPMTIWQQSEDTEESDDTEDTVLGLLRLSIDKSDPIRLLEPLAISGSILDTRLAWQLSSLFGASGQLVLPVGRQDQLTLDYATELEAKADLVTAAWVLQHLRDSHIRKQAIWSLFERNAGAISDATSEDERSIFVRLVEDLGIPSSLIFAAKALYAKAALQDPYLQARWLLRADRVDEAHDVLCTTVGPQSVIEQEYTALQQLVYEFPRRKPDGWQFGGQVYASCLRLLNMSATNKQGREGESALKALNQGLGGMEDGDATKTLEQRVAIIEMRKLAESIAREIDAGEETNGRDVDMNGSERFGGGSGMLEAYRKAMGQVV